MARALLLASLALTLAVLGCDAKTEPKTKEPVEATAPPADEPEPEPEAVAEPAPEAKLDEESEGSCYDKCMRAHMMEARSAESIEQDCKNECKDE